MSKYAVICLEDQSIEHPSTGKRIYVRASSESFSLEGARKYARTVAITRCPIVVPDRDLKAQIRDLTEMASINGTRGFVPWETHSKLDEKFQDLWRKSQKVT